MLRWQDRYHRTIKEERLKTISSWLVHRRNNRGVDTSFFPSELLLMLHFEDSHFNFSGTPRTAAFRNEADIGLSRKSVLVG
jgi:hypothetical protein